eukprot:SAG22_NODE_667_length_8010_cov_2.289091_3_plen_536_part_00
MEACCAALVVLLALSLLLLWRQQQQLQELLQAKHSRQDHWHQLALPRVESDIDATPVSADSVSYRVGSGAPQRTVAAHLRQFISVQDFGAVPDGKTDATAAIQAAIDVQKVRGGVEVIFPAGQYLVTKPLDITNRAAGGVSLRGEVSGLPNDGASATLIGATGGAVLDCSGSQFMTIRDLVIRNPAANAPAAAGPASTIGILFARTDKSEFVQFNAVHNVCIDLDSNPQANSGNGSVALYASAAELLNLENIYFRADYGMCNVCLNDFKVVSSYAQISAKYMSNSCITVGGQSTLATKLATGAAWFGSNTIGVRMENVYLQALGPPPSSDPSVEPPPPPRGVGLRIAGGNHMRFFGHAEGPSRIAEFVDSATNVTLSFTGIKSMQGPPVAAGVAGGSNAGFVGLSHLRLHFDGLPMTSKPAVKSTVPYLVECVDRGSELTNTRVDIPHDDGSMLLSNCFNCLGTVRTIGSQGTVAKGVYGGLMAGLHACRVGGWLTVSDAQSSTAVPNGALFFDGSKGQLSYKDGKGVVHALHGQ